MSSTIINTASVVPFAGIWNTQSAAHLLRRTLFGPRLDEINAAVTRGLDATVSLLLKERDIPHPPVKHVADSDDSIAVGETWHDKPFVGASRFYLQSLEGWYFQGVISPEFGIQEKMTLFWNNYFAISGVRDHRAFYKYLRLYQEKGLSSLREMLECITVEPAMLEFLDGDTNSFQNPNENFAREFLELYTIQKGPLAGPEDYTNYTEQDVQALAKVFTGWRRYEFEFSADPDVPIDSFFKADDHDESAKKMSHRFSGQVIPNRGDQEYKTAIDIVLNKFETARAFCRKLYRFFVYYEIDATTEREVIEPLAQTLYFNNYQLRPVLTQLFTSQHFYDMAVRGPMIKNPFELFGSLLRPFKAFAHVDLPLQKRYELGALISRLSAGIDMALLPPDVFGWKAYSQAPTYYRNWISPSLIKERQVIIKRFIGIGNHVNGLPIKLDLRGFTKSLLTPLEVNKFISETVRLFLPRNLHPEQESALKESLLQGLPDQEWTRQCAIYLNDPEGNPATTRSVEDRIRKYLIAMFTMVEFQLQ